MKKIIISSLIIFGLSVSAKAASVDRGLIHSFAVSSGIVFDRGVLMRVDCASVPATQAFNVNFVQFFDTTTLSSLPAATSINTFLASSANVATPQLMLNSTSTANGGALNTLGASISYEPYGISFSRDAYIFFGGAPIAGWGGCSMYWRRDDW